MSRKFSDTLKGVPKDEHIELAPNDGGKAQSVPRLLVKCNGGNLAALMRLADSRDNDKVIHIPYNVQLVADLATYLKNEDIGGLFGVEPGVGALRRTDWFMRSFTDEQMSKYLARWRTLLLASGLYHIKNLTTLLTNPDLVEIMVGYASTFEARVDLVTFSIAHRSLVPHLAAEAISNALTNDLFLPKLKLDDHEGVFKIHTDNRALMKYSIMLSEGCQCTDCKALRGQSAVSLDQSGKDSAPGARKRPRTDNARP